MGWTRGLEPPTTGITSRGSTIELRPPYSVQVARLAGLEPATYSLEGCCSILLSYRRSPDRVIRLKFFVRGWSGRRDSNSRPSGPKPDALPSCATPRIILLLEGGGQYSSQRRSSIPESTLTQFIFNVRVSLQIELNCKA